MKKGKTIFMKDTIELLQDLLEQHQFELLIPENKNTDRLRLVYLMNDAVESFLVFVNAGITGLYQKDYEGELDYSLSREGQGYPWMPSEAAFKVMDNLSKETQDASLLRLLKLYKRLPYPFMARMVAGALHKRKHQAVVRLLTEKIKHAAGTYPDRSFGAVADKKLKELLEKAEQIKRNMSIRDQDIQVDILREEPFTTAQDDVDFHVYLMIWDKKGINCRVKILRIPGAKEFVL